MPFFREKIDKRWVGVLRKISIAVLLWMITLTMIYYYNKSEKTQETLVMAINQISLNEMQATLEGFGYYCDVYLSEEAKKTFVKDIGYELGLNYCDITTERDGEIATTILTKNGANAKTEIKLITREQKISENAIESHQYLLIQIDLGNNVDAAIYYQKVLKEIYEELGIDADVTVNFCGNMEGMADLAIKNMIADQLLAQTDAKIVAENRSDELYTIYAYTEKVADYMKLGNKKINLNICSYYDENNQKTYFNVATPIISTDY